MLSLRVSVLFALLTAIALTSGSHAQNLVIPINDPADQQRAELAVQKYGEGWVKCKAGKYDEATSLLEESIAAVPTKPAYRTLALCLHPLGEYQRMRDAAQNGLAIHYEGSDVNDVNRHLRRLLETANGYLRNKEVQ